MDQSIFADGILKGHVAFVTGGGAGITGGVARAFAEAGADGISPSDMMDGRVAHIRAALDAEGFTLTPVMSYSTKFASNFYGPFRNAADSAPQFGDRRGYQLDVRNRSGAIAASVRCAEEGADILMIKPALPNLDILSTVRQSYNLPTAAYQVSGEYAMIKAAAKMGWIDENKAILETLTAIKRAGADLIATYFAKDAVKLLHV